MKIIFPVIVIISFLVQACSDSSSPDLSGALSEAAPLCGAASVATTNFFTEVESSQSLLPDNLPSSLRHRFVTADIEALKFAIKSGMSPITLDLFDDQKTQILIEEVKVLSSQNVIATGRLVDEAFSSFSLVINGRVVVAHLHSAADTGYVITYSGDGIHAIAEISSHDHQLCETENQENLSALMEANPDNDLSGFQAMETLAANPIIDILVAYTPAALTKVGGTDAMNALIQMGIADTNRSFSNSGVHLAVRLVGTMAVRQNDTNEFSPNLSALRGTSDGRWDEVHARRRELGADQVTLVGVYPNNGVNGIGYISASYSNAFTIAKTSSFFSFTFTHELGHNLGLQHSDGYVNSSARFRTIMAYGTVPRIRRFSNPQIDYNGYNTGSATQNSAAKINARGKYMAALSMTKVPLQAETAPLTPGASEVCQKDHGAVAGIN